MSEVRRMRRVEDGAMGWMQDHAVRPDADLTIRYLAYWRVYSREDQEDFGFPPAAYVTACGHWLEAAA